MNENQSREARRRAFIREHHPDRGGDAGTFIAGLRALGAEREQGSGPLPEVTFVRRSPWLPRKATAVIRWLRYGPRPPRVRLAVTPRRLLAMDAQYSTEEVLQRQDGAGPGSGPRSVLDRIK